MADKIDFHDEGMSYDHWATQAQMQSLLDRTAGMPRYHKFMENFAKGMASGKIGMEKAFRDAGRGLEVMDAEAKATAGTLRKDLSPAAKKSSERLTLLSAMTSGVTSRLDQMAKSAARVDGTLKGAFEDFTSQKTTKRHT